MSFSTSSNVFTIVVASGFLIISLSLIAFAVRSALSHNKRIERRLTAGGPSDISGPQVRQSKQSLLTQLGGHLTLPKAENITRLRFQLSQAGYYDASAVKKFIAIRAICLFAPQFLILGSWGFLSAKFGVQGLFVIASIVALAGLMGPVYFLRWKKGKRTDQCRKGFPDMMDLLVACIEAGLGLDAALIRVSHEIGERYPALKVNVEIMNLELRAGRLRHEAMVNFAERIDLDEAKALAIMLKQAEDMGSSIGAALRTFSEDMRAKRMLKAEEKAMALSAKLTVPLILFIFPTIMVLLLVPAAIRLMESLG